jgi:hypothetical protein
LAQSRCGCEDRGECCDASGLTNRCSQPLAARKIAHDDFNIEIRSTARSRQWWLILFSLDRMSRITRVGLWLLPWLPVCVAIIVICAHFDQSLLIDDAPLTLTSRMLQWPCWISLLAFVLGIVLLFIAAVRRMLKWRHASV